MIEVASDKLTPPSDEDNWQRAPKRGGRRDALSMFLLVVVGLLVLMYVLDWRAERVMVERSELAQGLKLEGVLGQRCRSEASGVEGEQLVLSCDGLGAQEVLGRLAQAKRAKSPALKLPFEQVVVRDTQATWLCQGEVSLWPDEGCLSKPLPDRATMERTRRRRQKE